MSIRLMTKVWDGAPYGGGTLIVLLALADWANDAGERIFPHIETLAEKARLSVKQTRTVLKTLVEDGFLFEGEQTRTGGRGKRLDYRINLERFTKLPSLEEAEIRASEEGSFGSETGKSSTGEGEISSSHIDEPSTDPSSDPSSNPSSTSTAVAVVQGPSDLEIAVQYFNTAARNCPKWTPAKQMTANRKKVITARLKEAGLDGWRRAVDLAHDSAFLGGPVPTHGDHRNWRMDIAWFAKSENFAKITEGKYPPGKGGPGPGRGLATAAAGIMAALDQR